MPTLTIIVAVTVMIAELQVQVKYRSGYCTLYVLRVKSVGYRSGYCHGGAQVAIRATVTVRVAVRVTGAVTIRAWPLEQWALHHCSRLIRACGKMFARTRCCFHLGP